MVWLKKQFRRSKKCADSGDDVHLALLDLRNTPRDAEIGSPMQRLMSRGAKTLIPTSDNLRKPCIVKPSLVHNHLMEYRQKQKFYYDQHANQDHRVNQVIPYAFKHQKVGNQQNMYQLVNIHVLISLKQAVRDEHTEEITAN